MSIDTNNARTVFFTNPIHTSLLHGCAQILLSQSNQLTVCRYSFKSVHMTYVSHAGSLEMSSSVLGKFFFIAPPKIRPHLATQVSSESDGFDSKCALRHIFIIPSKAFSNASNIMNNFARLKFGRLNGCSSSNGAAGGMPLENDTMVLPNPKRVRNQGHNTFKFTNDVQYIN